MIGVSIHPDERRVVEEFFQLFKTPWEFAVSGRTYDVLLLSGGVVDSEAFLTIRFHADRASGPSSQAVFRLSGGRIVTVRNYRLPIYWPLSVTSPVDPASEVPALCIRESINEDGNRQLDVGYDLFAEIEFLLTHGQPPENALIPALDLHIQLLREWILEAGLALFEIPPAPAGVSCIACLTHDIDFVSLRQHATDRSMLGFLYRATVGNGLDFLRGRRSFKQWARSLASVARTPFVLAGWARDFWLPFPEYLNFEQDRPATYFIIPTKNQPGRPLPGATANPLRATRYGAADVAEWLRILRTRGCEVALHGIDAWSDSKCARGERDCLAQASGASSAGLRMHWLYFSPESPAILDQAGFDYDSTSGYNEAVGFKAGTGQVFRPLAAKHLLELPMHIQDTALFYPGRMHLSETQAWDLCLRVLAHARQFGGVLTLLWHDRSLVPERLWGGFYRRLLDQLDSFPVWFATASEAVAWFRRRRQVGFRCDAASQPISDRGNVRVRLENVPDSADYDLVVRMSWMSADGTVRSENRPLRGADCVVFGAPPLAAFRRNPASGHTVLSA